MSDLHLTSGEPSATAQSSAAAPAENQRPVRVLLAEDSVPNQRIVGYMLRSLGCEALIVDTGVKALEALRQQAFDLVLMDVRMPEMNGITTTEHIRRECDAEAQPRIYGLTAGVTAEDRQACLDAGMDGFLAKPVSLDELAALVRSL